VDVNGTIGKIARGNANSASCARTSNAGAFRRLRFTGGPALLAFNPEL